MKNSEISPDHCPVCNTSWEQIRTSQKVGCPMCYQYFSDAGGKMEQLLRTIHQKYIHKEGRKIHLNLSEEDLILQSRLLRLEEELRHLVEEEDYEKAAEMAEKIDALRKQTSDFLEEPV